MPSRRTNVMPPKVPRARKRAAGRTPISETPLRLRMTGVAMTPAIEQRTRELLARRLARFGTFLERVDVRFKDVNGPRGGMDTVARIQLTVAGRPSVFVEERAHDADQALSRAAMSVARAMDRSVGKLGLRAPAPTRSAREMAPRARPAPTRVPPAASEERPPRRRRGMAYRLEASATKPSRKSTRKSANRLKTGNKLARRTRRAKHSPKARASRAQTQRRRSRVR